MTFEANTPAPRGARSIAPTVHVPDFVNAILRFGARVGAKAGALVRAMQVSRMKSVLMSMSDEHLAEMGVKRSEIDRHAKILIMGE